MFYRLFALSVILLTAVVLALTWMVPGVAAESSPPVKTPPIALKASDVLPKEILVGPNYKVEQTVTNDGLVNTYKLVTDYGPFTIESTSFLIERINEMKALDHMEELAQTKTFADALKKGATAPLRTAKGLVTHPIDTVSGVASGVASWFGDIGRAVTSDDPDQENVVSAAIGYAGIKRKYAYEYKINAYTRYEPVQRKLTEIARASVAGGLAPKAAFGLIKKPIGTALRLSGTADTMRKVVRDKSPAELDDMNDKKLIAMGISDSLAKEFLKNPHYDPQESTLLVGELESMKNVAGRESFVKVAALAPEYMVARYMRERAQMMANYHLNVSPVVRIVQVGGTPFLQRKDGVIIGPFPLDYVVWTAALWRREKIVSESIERLRGVTGKELWIGGTVDPEARKALESRGWKVDENVGDKLIKK